MTRGDAGQLSQVFDSWPRTRHHLVTLACASSVNRLGIHIVGTNGLGSPTVLLDGVPDAHRQGYAGAGQGRFLKAALTRDHIVGAEPHRLAPSASTPRSYRYLGLAGSSTTDKDEIAKLGDELPVVERAQLRLIDWRFVKLEAVEVTSHREVSLTHAVQELLETQWAKFKENTVREKYMKKPKAMARQTDCCF